MKVPVCCPVLLTVLILAPGSALALAGPTADSPEYIPQYIDLGLVGFSLWDTCFVGDTFKVRRFWVHNYSEVSASTDLLIGIFDQDSSLIYNQIIPIVGLAPGHSIPISGPFLSGNTYSRPGVYVAALCSLVTPDSNPSNDGGRKRVVVLPRNGVRKTSALTGGLESIAGQVVSPSRFLLLLKELPDLVLYNHLGRRVHGLPRRSGPYFLRNRSAGTTVKLALVL